MSPEFRKITLSAMLASFSFIELSEDVNYLLESFDSKNFIPHQSHLKEIFYSRPICLPGVPNKIDKNTQDSLAVNYYQCGFAHYNYLIITSIIVATDSKAASRKALNFKGQLDTTANRNYPKSGDFKMHLFDEPMSMSELSKFEHSNTVLTIL